MYAYSPRHLAEWAELIGAELPDEYPEREYKYMYSYGCENECKRE